MPSYADIEKMGKKPDTSHSYKRPMRFTNNLLPQSTTNKHAGVGIQLKRNLDSRDASSS